MGEKSIGAMILSSFSKLGFISTAGNSKIVFGVEIFEED